MSLVSPRGDQNSQGEDSILTSLTNLGNGLIKINKDWDGYSRRIKITVDHTTVDKTVNFLLSVDLSLQESNFWDYVKDGGGDIRVSADDETTEYARHILSCDTTALTGEVIVLIPTISNTVDTDIYLFYGNPNNDDYADTDPYGKNAVYADSGYAQTPLSVKGGVVRVIDSAMGDIARTTSGWIEDEKYGWTMIRDATAVSGEFDSAVTRTGKFTLKLSTTDTTGRCRAILTPTTTVAASSQKYLITLKPSIEYYLSVYAKTTNAALNSVYAQMSMYKSDFSGSATLTAATNKITGDNDWTLLEKKFTTNADCAYGQIILWNTVAGNISDAWFDVNDPEFGLEPVSTITAPSASKLYPQVTAVSSEDNIDQSQVVSNTTLGFGTINQKYRAQQFLPTKKNLTSVVIRKIAGSGTFVGDVTISLQADSSNNPSGTPLATVTVPNATWVGLTADTDYTVALPQTLIIDDSTKYWIVLMTSTADDSNTTGLRCVNSDAYTNGLFKSSANGVTWSTTANFDLYFKTLYSKNTTNFTVRTDTETMSVTAPTTDGWANGTVIDTATLGITPLTLSPGVNNIYYSSNGSATADGTVDPSLQATIENVVFDLNDNFTDEYETSDIDFKTITAVDNQIEKTTDGQNVYEFKGNPTKFKMKDTDGDGYTYLTFSKGTITASRE